MYRLLGSENKTKIILYLANNSNKSVKLISKETNINYKNAFKIIQELFKEGIILKEKDKYYINTHLLNL
ncbi:MAG: hypothetical protein ACMXYB_00365 [Candidatus Woesearchaeota archaeon]